VKREGALTKINSLLDMNCNGCKTRKQLEKEYGVKGWHAKIDGFCNQKCPIGKELQELGKQLGKGAAQCVTLPRKQRREMAIAD
jgi:hypothetical protein